MGKGGGKMFSKSLAPSLGALGIVRNLKKHNNISDASKNPTICDQLIALIRHDNNIHRGRVLQGSPGLRCFFPSLGPRLYPRGRALRGPWGGLWKAPEGSLDGGRGKDLDRGAFRGPQSPTS